MLPKPFHGASEPLVERRRGLEPEGRAGPRSVGHPARLAIRLRPVPDDLPLEADQPADRLRKRLEADLLPGPDVDRFGAVVALGRERDCFGRVIDIQELPGRGAAAPHLNDRPPGLLRLDELRDQGRNDVRRARVNIVARPIQVRRQHVDRVEPVLLAIGLPLNQQPLLREPVGAMAFALGIGASVGSSQRSVQLRPVYMANKSSINSDLRGWRTPSVSGEELQTPGVRPTGDGGIARGLPVPRG